MIKREREREKEREERRIALVRSGTDVIKRCDGCWKIRWVRVLFRPGSTGINQPEEFLQFSHTTVIITYMGRCSWRSSRTFGHGIAGLCPMDIIVRYCNFYIYIYILNEQQSPLCKIRYKSFRDFDTASISEERNFYNLWMKIGPEVINYDFQPTRNKSRRYIHMQIKEGEGD